MARTTYAAASPYLWGCVPPPSGTEVSRMDLNSDTAPNTRASRHTRGGHEEKRSVHDSSGSTGEIQHPQGTSEKCRLIEADARTSARAASHAAQGAHPQFPGSRQRAGGSAPPRGDDAAQGSRRAAPGGARRFLEGAAAPRGRAARRRADKVCGSRRRRHCSAGRVRRSDRPRQEGRR